ncbi:NYN domain-containing protein [Gordonibacter sp. An230]|uniref:NYN domain-containing protein n=1 Tax=Gordonibacter sp. An230 TaxID=1965592 RepID=UPI0019525AEE|nr:NYN domain-containing protein [Gordonibacter sp. An230]
MDTKQSSEKRFALLIDADNVSAKYIKPIIDELSKYGTVTYKRIYGDWTLALHAKWKDALLENSITPIQQFGYTQGKNATDSAMIIDAMDILYTRSVEGFCIVSSDSDFTRLASRIRESGLTVVGMGEKKTPVPFRKACDIFTTLELLLPASGGKANGRGKGRSERAGQVSDGQNGTGPSIEEIEQAVVSIVTDNQNNGKSTGLGEVGSRLLKRHPDFDVRSYGTNQLKKLLDEFESVVVTKDGNSVTVELAEEKASAAASEDARADAPSEDVQGVEGAVIGRSSEDGAASSGAAPAVAAEPRQRSRRSSRRRRDQAAAPEGGPTPEAAPEATGEGSEDGAAAAVGRADEASAPALQAERSDGASSGEGGKAALQEKHREAAASEDAKAAKPRRGRSARAARAAKRAEAEAKGAQAKVAGDDEQADRAEQGEPSRRSSARKAKEAARGASTEASRRTAATEAQSESEDARERKGRAAVRTSKRRPASDASPSIAPHSASRAKRPAEAAEASETPEQFIRRLVREAGAEGVALSEVGKRVRTRFRTFKLRELGYTQLRAYVADLDDVEIEKRGRDFYARLGE